MSYLAFVLDEKSRDRLLTYIRPAHPDIIAHHVTLAFGKTNEEYDQIIEEVKGKTVQIIGIVGDYKAEALIVSIGGQTVRQDRGTYHITLSINKSKGATPVYSNELIKQNKVTVFRGLFYVTGTIEILD